MKPFLFLLVLLAAAAASAASASGLSSTNRTLFDCEGGADFSPTNIVLRDRVRVLDQASGMYLECDLLTVRLQTNATREARSDKTVVRGGRTNQFESGQLESIVAEGNVFITTAEQQIAGDRAVYTATNDLFVVTGEIVLLGMPQGVGIGKKAIFDRLTGSAHAVGVFAFESLGSLRGAATNSPLRRPQPQTPDPKPQTPSPRPQNPK